MKLNLILAHGYLGFRHIGPFEYFNGVKKYLESNYPVTVVETKVDPLRGVEVRGGQLREQILVAMGRQAPSTPEEHAIAGHLDPDQPLHLISHSMGGLDCRYVLSPAYADNVAGDPVTTLTTIAGPHRGSPTVDLLVADLAGKDLNPVERRLAKFARNTFKVLGISLQGLADLTTEWTAAFNQKYIDSPEVRYFSVGGGGRLHGLPTAAVMYWSWKYIKEKTGEVNDGAVPVSSARWGEFNPDLWPADHPEEIGHDVNCCGEAPKNFDYLAKYGELVEQLLAL